MINLIRNTDILLLVVDLSAQTVLEDIEALLAILRDRDVAFEPADDDDQEDTLGVGPQGLILCTKADLPGAADNFKVLKELRTGPPPMLAVSAETGDGLDVLVARVFEMLDVIRVYSKRPGKPADKDKPFVLPAGSTIGELARMVHKDVAAGLKYARIWGETVFDAQQVHAGHVLHDRDIVELHA